VPPAPRPPTPPPSRPPGGGGRGSYRGGGGFGRGRGQGQGGGGRRRGGGGTGDGGGRPPGRRVTRTAINPRPGLQRPASRARPVSRTRAIARLTTGRGLALAPRIASSIRQRLGASTARATVSSILSGLRRSAGAAARTPARLPAALLRRSQPGSGQPVPRPARPLPARTVLRVERAGQRRAAGRGLISREMLGRSRPPLVTRVAAASRGAAIRVRLLAARVPRRPLTPVRAAQLVRRSANAGRPRGLLPRLLSRITPSGRARPRAPRALASQRLTRAARAIANTLRRRQYARRAFRPRLAIGGANRGAGGRWGRRRRRDAEEHLHPPHLLSDQRPALEPVSPGPHPAAGRRSRAGAWFPSGWSPEMRRLYPKGVEYDAHGAPNLSPYAHAVTGRLRSLAGRVAVDEPRALANIGLRRHPRGFSWHYHGEKMMLVPTKIFRSTPRGEPARAALQRALHPEHREAAARWWRARDSADEARITPVTLPTSVDRQLHRQSRRILFQALREEDVRIVERKLRELIEDSVLEASVRTAYLEEVLGRLSEPAGVGTSVYDVMKEVAAQEQYQCRPESRVSAESLATFGPCATAVNLDILFRTLADKPSVDLSSFRIDLTPSASTAPNLLAPIWDDEPAPVSVTLSQLGGAGDGTPRPVWVVPEVFADVTDIDTMIVERQLQPTDGVRGYRAGFVQFRIDDLSKLEIFRPTALDGMGNPLWEPNQDPESLYGELGRPQGWERGIPELIIRELPPDRLRDAETPVLGELKKSPRRTR
jgi:hypothetical protein